MIAEGREKGSKWKPGSAESPGTVPKGPSLSNLWAYHDPGVVHELRDGHSLSGLGFQQVPDEHLHCGGRAGDRDSSGASVPLLLLPTVFREKPGQVAWGQTAQGASLRATTLSHPTGPSHRQGRPTAALSTQDRGIHAHVHARTRTPTCMHTHIHVHTRTCSGTPTCAHTHTHACPRAHARTHAHTHAHAHPRAHT